MMSRVPTGLPPVLLYLVTEDWYFLSHRLPMATAAQQAGYQVHVATNVNKYAARIEAYGFHLHSLQWRRGKLQPAAPNRHRPAGPCTLPTPVAGTWYTTSHFTAGDRRIAGGAWAADRAARCPGGARLYVYFAVGQGARLAPSTQGILALASERARIAILVQNLDDRNAMQSMGVDADRLFLIPGSGVDVVSLTPLAEPSGPVTMAFIGRLLEDKGLRVLIAAHDLLVQRGILVRLLIAGEPDPANPASIPRT